MITTTTTTRLGGRGRLVAHCGAARHLRHVTAYCCGNCGASDRSTIAETGAAFAICSREAAISRTEPP
eukprot:2147362-Prymnesium_polylepis.1